MTRKRLPPDDPREWLNRARSNLACAKAHVPEAYLEDLCFDAQQCAEKAVKAVFISRGANFPYVHDLKKLLALLEDNGLKIPKYVWEASKLSPYAIVTRSGPRRLATCGGSFIVGCIICDQIISRGSFCQTAILRWSFP